MMITEVEPPVARTVDERFDERSLLGLMEQAKLFIDIEQERRRLEDRLKVVKRYIDLMTAPLTEQMVSEGFDKLSAGGLTITPSSKFYCSKRSNESGATKERLCEVLKELGFGDMVAEDFSSAELKSKVKGWIEAEVEIPAKLAELINYGEEPVMSVRKS